MSYVPANECHEVARLVILGEATICAAGACLGDSGGPLFDKENQVVVGLTSYEDAQCGPGNPSIGATVADNVSSYSGII